jgi:hypothetical protein
LFQSGVKEQRRTAGENVVPNQENIKVPLTSQKTRTESSAPKVLYCRRGRSVQARTVSEHKLRSEQVKWEPRKRMSQGFFSRFGTQSPNNLIGLPVHVDKSFTCNKCSPPAYYSAVIAAVLKKGVCKCLLVSCFAGCYLFVG